MSGILPSSFFNGLSSYFHDKKRKVRLSNELVRLSKSCLLNGTVAILIGLGAGFAGGGIIAVLIKDQFFIGEYFPGLTKTVLVGLGVFTGIMGASIGVNNGRSVAAEIIAGIFIIGMGWLVANMGVEIIGLGVAVGAAVTGWAVAKAVNAIFQRFAHKINIDHESISYGLIAGPVLLLFVLLRFSSGV